MTRVLLDTHTWVWALMRSSALSAPAHKAISCADEAFVSAASVYEIAQKVRRNAWPELTAEMLDRMVSVEGSGIAFMPVTVGIMQTAGLLEWTNRDPFDRMIAATAIADDLALITKDKALQELEGVTVIWR